MCLPVYGRVYLCMGVPTCVCMHGRVYLCRGVSTCILACLLMYGHVYLCMHGCLYMSLCGVSTSVGGCLQVSVRKLHTSVQVTNVL